MNQNMQACLYLDVVEWFLLTQMARLVLTVLCAVSLWTEAANSLMW